MSSILVRGGQTALATVFLAQMAMADVTAREVWENFNGYLVGAGYEVTGAEAMSGDTLTVSGLSVVQRIPSPPATVRMNLGDVAFTENGDGTVAIRMPGHVPMQFEGINEDGQPFSTDIDLRQTGPSLTVSGTTEDMLYTYAAASVGVSLGQVTIDGQPVPPEVAGFSATLANMRSSTRVREGDVRTFDQQMDSDAVSMAFNFKDPEGREGQAEMTAALDSLSFKGTGTVPNEMNMNDVQAMLNAGFAIDGTYSYNGGTSQIRGVDEDGATFDVSSEAAGGSFRVVMNKDRLVYDVRQEASVMSILTSDFPLPISVEMDVMALEIAIPAGEALAPQDYTMVMELGGLSVSEQLWGIVDPAGILPRSPATLLLDLTGKATVLFNYLDPRNADKFETGETAPAEVNTLSVNQLKLSAAGAELTGQGTFSFNNDDLQSFGGFPAPNGRIDMKLVGGNGLLDRLVKMGLLSEDDAGGARLMMGLLAVPGEGEDTLESAIEINDQGHVMANGQRIQ